MNAISRKLKGARSVYEQKGLLSVMNAALKTVLPSDNVVLSWESRVMLRCHPVSSGQPAAAQCLSQEQARDMAGINTMTARGISAALKRGERCWVIRQEGTVVAYVWISAARRCITSDTGYQLVPTQGQGYWWRDVYVDPQHRGRGLPAQLLQSWLDTARATTAPELYTEVAPDNPGSLRAHQKLGFATVCKLYAVCIMGARFYFVRGGELPRFAFRFHPLNVYTSTAAE